MSKEIQYILGELLKKEKKTLAIAESCTGGFTSNLITDVPGSSVYFMGGITAYSNQAKISILNVPEKVIQEEGAVSRTCAITMAQNVRKILRANIGIGLTGIAGPNGSTTEKPLGSVYIAVNDGAKTICNLYRFSGSRLEVKQKASETALKMVRDLISGK